MNVLILVIKTYTRGLLLLFTPFVCQYSAASSSTQPADSIKLIDLQTANARLFEDKQRLTRLLQLSESSVVDLKLRPQVENHLYNVDIMS